MKRALPPLLAVRAFEAAARHLSFSRAADELHVTQGAVSRQIKNLEDYLQQPLFIRLVRRVELTPYGRTFYAAASQGLDIIERAASRVVPLARDIIRISLPQSLASLWLMPRLSSFTEIHPSIDVRVVTSMQSADFSRDNIDVAIRLGTLPGRTYAPDQPRVPHELVSNWRGVHAVHLWDEVLTPVLSKQLLAQGAELHVPEDLRHYKLLHVTVRPYAWEDWFRTRGVEYPQCNSMEFGHFFMALEAARRSSGVALAPKLFVERTDYSEQLVCPFESHVRSAGEYYFLCQERRLEEPTIQHLLSWLLTQDGAEEAVAL